MKYGGIDGCKYGWILIRQENDMLGYGGIYSTINDLIEDHLDLDRILIDIPIGLSSQDRLRTIETLMKKSLGKRHSTVFDVPCRKALTALNYEDAKRINQGITGKKISIQSYYISKKIKELDDYIRQKNTVNNTFIESHPEICFKYLNNSIVQSKKSTPEGIQERLAILSNYNLKSLNLYENILTGTKRKDVKKDDIIDALCLCIVNSLGGADNLGFIQNDIDQDEFDIPIRVAYYQP